MLGLNDVVFFKIFFQNIQQNKLFWFVRIISQNISLIMYEKPDIVDND